MSRSPNRWTCVIGTRFRFSAQGFTIFAVLASIMYAGQTQRYVPVSPPPKKRPSKPPPSDVLLETRAPLLVPSCHIKIVRYTLTSTFICILPRLLSTDAKNGKRNRTDEKDVSRSSGPRAARFHEETRRAERKAKIVEVIEHEAKHKHKTNE